MKLTRTVSYALQAAVHLAIEGSGQPVPCNRLAADGKMPERFLLQILRELVAHGILNSTRGVDGGYSLGRPAGEISLLNIIEAIEGPLSPSISFEGLPSTVKHRLEDFLESTAEDTRRRLDAIKLTDLLAR